MVMTHHKRSATRWIVGAAAAMLLVSIGGPSHAAFLNSDQLREARGTALIEIINAAGTIVGYGAVITADGHVLTAAHVVGTLPADGFVGRLVPFGPVPPGTPAALPWALERVETWPREDVALLRFKDGIKPGMSVMPFNLAAASFGSITYRVLTKSLERGLRAVYPAAPISIDQTGDTKIELQGGVQLGHSGSPMLDPFGAQVGVVIRGTTGLFYVRSANAIAALLDGKELGGKVVKLSALPPPLPKVKIVVVNAGATTSGTTTIGVPLRNALREMQNYLTPAAEVTSDRPWERLAQYIFLDESKTTDEIRRIVVSHLDSERNKSWLRSEQTHQINLLAFNVGVDSVQAARLQIGILADGIAVQDLDLGPLEKLTSSNPEYFKHIAVVGLQGLLKDQPQLIRNRLVLAECFQWYPPLAANSIETWRFESVAAFRENLDKILSKKTGAEQFKAKAKNWQKCAFEAENKDWRVPEHLAEIMIKVSFLGPNVYWEAHPPWDEQTKFPPLPNAKSVGSVNQQVMKDLSERLAVDVDRTWAALVKAVRP